LDPSAFLPGANGYLQKWPPSALIPSAPHPANHPFNADATADIMVARPDHGCRSVASRKILPREVTSRLQPSQGLRRLQCQVHWGKIPPPGALACHMRWDSRVWETQPGSDLAPVDPAHAAAWRTPDLPNPDLPVPVSLFERESEF
jgi:hypothetical protein